MDTEHLKRIIADKTTELVALRTLARLMGVDLTTVPTIKEAERTQETELERVYILPPLPDLGGTTPIPPPATKPPRYAQKRHVARYPGGANQVVLDFIYKTYGHEPVHTTILYANITKALGIPKGTVSSCLMQLVRDGFIHRDRAERTYEVAL